MVGQTLVVGLTTLVAAWVLVTTAGIAAPATGEAAPTTSEAAPTTSEAAPTTSEASPTTSEASPTTSEAAPPRSSSTAPRQGTTLRGRVSVSSLPPADARPNVGELGTSRTRDAADRRRSVVYLEEAPRGAFEELPGARARINQINEQFVPRVLAITTGTTVDFPNSDRIYHNVFSLSKTRTFDLGRYAAGGSRAVRFDRPGIVRVFCDIHSHMSAWVLVFNHPFFAATDEDGRYAIPNVPPGTYSLAVWHETLPPETRRIVVPEGGGTIEVDFSLGR